jgi:hypothetical protein
MNVFLDDIRGEMINHSVKNNKFHIILQKPEFGMTYLHILEIVMGFGLNESKKFVIRRI